MQEVAGVSLGVSLIWLIRNKNKSIGLRWLSAACFSASLVLAVTTVISFLMYCDRSWGSPDDSFLAGILEAVFGMSIAASDLGRRYSSNSYNESDKGEKSLDRHGVC